MKRIVIEAVPVQEARLPCYREPGSGDWWQEGDTLHVLVAAETLDDDAYLIALHELVEAKLCQHAGVTQEMVDAFDANFTGNGEPGDDKAAPYRKQHRQAMLIEHLLAQMLGRDDYGTVK